MGHFVVAGQIEPHDFAGQHAQAFVAATFVADVEQQLQAQADAQKRLAGGDRLADRLDQMPPLEFGHRIAEGSDAGQHDLFGLGQHGRIAGNRGLIADLFESLLHAAKVAHLVVDDGDQWLGSAAGRITKQG